MLRHLPCLLLILLPCRSTFQWNPFLRLAYCIAPFVSLVVSLLALRPLPPFVSPPSSPPFCVFFSALPPLPLLRIAPIGAPVAQYLAPSPNTLLLPLPFLPPLSFSLPFFFASVFYTVSRASRSHSAWLVRSQCAVSGCPYRLRSPQLCFRLPPFPPPPWSLPGRATLSAPKGARRSAPTASLVFLFVFIFSFRVSRLHGEPESRRCTRAVPPTTSCLFPLLPPPPWLSGVFPLPPLQASVSSAQHSSLSFAALSCACHVRGEPPPCLTFVSLTWQIGRAHV